MSAAIVGFGTWLPDHVRTNDAWPESFRQHAQAHAERTFNDIPQSQDAESAALVLQDLAREAHDPFLGAQLRHVADDHTNAVDAEIIAARAALDDAEIVGADVDLVISNAVVPDRITPPSANAVAHAIGARRALSFGMDVACASSAVQLEIARAYVEAGLAKVVLLTQSHLLLRAMPMLHPATPGLGDAASAMVVARGSGLTLRGTFGQTHGDFVNAVSWVRGAEPVNDPPWWKAGCDYRVGSFAPDQVKLLMRETVSYGAATVREAAARAAIDVERIDVLASVQPRGFLPGAIAARLGLPRERAITTYESVGHIGLCGPVFNLMRARELGLLQPHMIAAVYGQGAGFTRAAAILEVETARFTRA